MILETLGEIVSGITGGKMKSNKILYLMTAFLLLQTFLHAQGVQPPGSGTETDPYQVSSLDHLLWMSTNSVDEMFFEQTSDIDASDTRNWNFGDHDNDPNTPDSAMGLQPIGEFSNSIAQYDGNGHTISDLYINRLFENAPVGLFRRLSNARIENITLQNVEIKAGSKAGAVCGSCKESRINNCNTSGIILGETYLGGIAGYCENSIIKECTNSCRLVALVSVINSIGGISGFVTSVNGHNSILMTCSNSGEIIGYNQVGGITGSSENAKYFNCINTGTIRGTSEIGGISGVCYNSDLAGCHSDGTITGNSFTGGISGRLDNCELYDSYSTSSVYGTNSTGGLTGFVCDSFINFCYSAGRIRGSNNTGGFIGLNEIGSNDIQNCFWDTETSGQLSSAGGTGKTTTEMKNIATYTDISTTGLDTPWDFADNPFNDESTNDYWNIDPNINNGYPFLDEPYVEVNDDENIPEVPEISTLNGNYPNPFNPETTISYSLAETGRVNIVVYNIKGQKVTTIVNEQQEKGNHSVKWFGRDSNSKNVSSGVYFVRMKAGKDISTHKMLLLK